LADLPDVNVWLALAYEGHAYHAVASAWLAENDATQVLFCRVTQMGLLRLLTLEAVMGPDVLAQTRAWSAYDRLSSDERIAFASEPPGVENQWRRFTRERRPRPRAWTDAYLAAFAASGRHRLVTFDFGLASLRGITSLLLGGTTAAL
jgi:hypothetical protein